MRFAIISLLLFPSLVSADVIRQRPGECPVGSEKRIRNHAEVCVPMDCTQEDVCPDGSHCVELCTCWAEREYYGRRAVPRMIDTEIGRCNASGACDEGRVVERKECQPDVATGVQTMQATTQPTSNEASMEEASMEEASMEEASMDIETMAPSSAQESTEEPTATDEDSGGCSVSGSATALSFAWLFLLRRRR